ncbi:MAG: M13 family metallopeptidase [Bryobacterales bacterium]|nr:M13 family metallopeptidase [Bryobacterales bacterium]
MRFPYLLLLTAGAVLAQQNQAQINSAPQNPGFDIKYIDRSADPCVDFYKFSCGGWISANPLPPDQSRWGRFDALQDRNRAILQNVLETASSDKPGRSAIEQKIGDFYYACMDLKTIDARGTTPLKADLDRIAGMKDKKALAEVVAHMFRMGAPPFFFFSSEQDAKDSTKEIAGLDQGGLGLPDRDYYFKTDQKSVDLRKQYIEHVTKMFQLLGSTPADAAKKAQAVMAIETALADGSFDRVTRRDPEKVYHKMTVKELSDLTPDFDWSRFFKDVGAPSLQSLDVSVPPFQKALNGAIQKTSLDDLKTYLAWHLVHASVPVMPKSFVDENFNFYGKTLLGAQEQRPRWKRCVDLTDNQLPDALGRAFIEKTLGQEGKDRTQKMVAEIEKALEQDIQAVDWMSPETKKQALLKLQAITNKIGDKAHWLDYSGVRMARDDAYGDSARASAFELARQLGKIGKPVDKTDWQMSQPTVNAYYDAQENDINFPAGILQPPFWDNKLDDAVNYGAIGAVIGHELTHGFDDQGRQFDAKGNLRDWWTEADAKAFEERADCLVKQYGNYTAVDDVKLNGKLTLGENTADNGGLRLAYMALMDSYKGKEPAPMDGLTAQQRFFLGFGQIWCENETPESKRQLALTNPHSLPEFRVNGAVSNMPEFGKAFGCKPGQAMAPAQSCRVW